MAAARFLVGAVAHHWKRMVLPLAAGAGLAVGAAALLGKQTWEATGTMLYTAPPVPESQRGLYTPPDLFTLVSLIKSPETLAGLREEFDLPVPDSLLDKLFKVTAPRNTQAVTVALQWGEAEKAAALTNRLMERFIDQVRDHRRRKMDGYLADYEARVQDCDGRQARATAAFQQYLRQHNLLDLTSEGETVRREIETLQTVRSNALREEVAVAAQRARLVKEVNEFKRKDQSMTEEEKKFEAALESVADNRRRQDRLRELIDDDKKRQELVAELTNRRKEYERASQLRDRGALGQSEVDSVAKEIDILTAKLNDSTQVKSWKAELTKIDEMVVPKGPAKSQGSPIIQQTLFRQLELDLRTVALQTDLYEAEKGISSLRKRQSEVQVAVRQSDGLQKEIEGAAADRQKLTDQTALFRRLRDQQASEFAVVAPARPGPFPVGSNRKLFLIAGLLLGAAAAVGRASFSEWRATRHRGRQAARDGGAAVLGEVTADDTVGQRLVVSALRDWLPEYGATFLFLGDGSDDPLPWAVGLGRRLSARDERVLVVDCRVGELARADRAEVPGIGNYLSYETDDVADDLAPDDAPGLDVLPAGTAKSLDSLASHRMAALLARVRQTYSVVLLIGPDLGRQDGVELLGRYSDGVVPVLSRRVVSGSGAGVRRLTDRYGGRVRALVVADGGG